MSINAVIRSLVCLAAAAVAGAPLASAQNGLDQTGFPELVERLGPGNQPTGAGVPVAQVEASFGGCYAPDATRPEFAHKSLTLMSGPGSGLWSGIANGVGSVSLGSSSHATAVGLYWFGAPTGMAPGLAAVDVYDAGHFLGSGFLNGVELPTEEALSRRDGTRVRGLPELLGVKIVNNSWIGSAGESTQLLLRKLDYAVVEQGLFVVSGVNNGAGAHEMPLLSHCFNGVCVGRSDGLHRSGDTGLGVDGPGRMKPELVAPAPFTSYCTPLVCGAAALLVQTARTHPSLASNPDAELPEVLKAVLMAGAEHRAGWSNGAPSSGALRGATRHPLDPVYGADELDVDHSHWILTAGEQPAAERIRDAQVLRPAGWSEIELGSRESRWLRFEAEGVKRFVSIVAAWNRVVDPSLGSYALPDLDLELWRVDPQSGVTRMVGERGAEWFAAGNVCSDSRTDNVEHLYVVDLQPGEYLLQVRRGKDELPRWRVAVAWELACGVPREFGSGAARLRTRGVPARFAGEFELRVEGAVPGSVGVVVCGEGVGERRFGGGVLLVRPPVRRVGVVRVDARGEARFEVVIEAGMVGRGVGYQVWFGEGVATNAVEVGFCE
jgi:hypothetical protein